VNQFFVQVLVVDVEAIGVCKQDVEYRALYLGSLQKLAIFSLEDSDSTVLFQEGDLVLRFELGNFTQIYCVLHFAVLAWAD
jgi:hypothetical protein